MDQHKKRRVRNMTILGAISGLIFSLVLYFGVAQNASYFMFTVFGGLLGGAQGYLTK